MKTKNLYFEEKEPSFSITVNQIERFNPLSARAFFLGFFFKHRKFDFVTQFLRNGSNKMQSFVYNFVENFKLFYENVKIFA